MLVAIASLSVRPPFVPLSLPSSNCATSSNCHHYHSTFYLIQFYHLFCDKALSQLHRAVCVCGSCDRLYVCVAQGLERWWWSKVDSKLTRAHHEKSSRRKPGDVIESGDSSGTRHASVYSLTLHLLAVTLPLSLFLL